MPPPERCSTARHPRGTLLCARLLPNQPPQLQPDEFLLGIGRKLLIREASFGVRPCVERGPKLDRAQFPSLAAVADQSFSASKN